MTIALRDQRAKLYAFGDTEDSAGGASGFEVPTYTLRASGAADKAWWCRLEPMGGQEITIGQAAEYLNPVVIAFSDEVDVPLQGVVKLVTTGDVYRILSPSRRRLAREIAVLALFADKAQFNLAGG